MTGPNVSPRTAGRKAAAIPSEVWTSSPEPRPWSSPEGYATAASLSDALGHATVAAFDSGNLPAVATALKARFPDKPMVIAGDNDVHVEQTQGINFGRTKAEEAARAVGGKAFFPIFAPGE